MTQPPPPPTTHLGDGAYAIYDGFGVMLRANSHQQHECTGEVYLEPATLSNFFRWLTSVYPITIEVSETKEKGPLVNKYGKR